MDAVLLVWVAQGCSLSPGFGLKYQTPLLPPSHIQHRHRANPEEDVHGGEEVIFS